MEKAYHNHHTLYYYLLGFVIFTSIFLYIYIFPPFETVWADVLVNLMIVSAAGWATFLAFLLWREFSKGELPKKIWANFALGLGCWAVGDLVWALYAIYMDEVPLVSGADFFYTISFIFLTIAFFHQFCLIFHNNHSKCRLWLGLAIVAALALSVLAATIWYAAQPESEAGWFESFVGFFYPIGELFFAFAALYLFMIFGKGLLGRVWVGIVFFIVADALYALLTYTGLYAYSVEGTSVGTIIADVLYFDAYLVLALGIFMQLLLSRYGPPRSAVMDFERVVSDQI
jgi:hypothetical protein